MDCIESDAKRCKGDLPYTLEDITYNTLPYPKPDMFAFIKYLELKGYSKSECDDLINNCCSDKFQFEWEDFVDYRLDTSTERADIAKRVLRYSCDEWGRMAQEAEYNNWVAMLEKRAEQYYAERGCANKMSTEEADEAPPSYDTLSWDMDIDHKEMKRLADLELLRIVIITLLLLSKYIALQWRTCIIRPYVCKHNYAKLDALTLHEKVRFVQVANSDLHSFFPYPFYNDKNTVKYVNRRGCMEKMDLFEHYIMRVKTIIAFYGCSKKTKRAVIAYIKDSHNKKRVIDKYVADIHRYNSE